MPGARMSFCPTMHAGAQPGALHFGDEVSATNMANSTSIPPGGQGATTPYVNHKFVI